MVIWYNKNKGRYDMEREVLKQVIADQKECRSPTDFFMHTLTDTRCLIQN